jgi:septal ring factor EnvC (AmiA/AmiB activator)
MAGYTTNLPVNGAFNVTAVYGQSGKYWKDGHKGVDITASLKSIYSVCDGEVTVVGFDEGGWGRYVSVKPDGFERIRIIFCHLEKNSVKVKKGDKVSRKTVLGTMGTTGNSTGVHLHIEMRIDNKSVDITPYLLIPNKKASGLNGNDFKFDPKDQKAALDKMQKAFDGVSAYADKTDENDKLKSEIERLKKALSEAENRIQNAKKALG